MQIGIVLIAMSVICLVASFVLTVPSWINLIGIGLGVAGLLMLGMGRKKGGGDGG